MADKKPSTRNWFLIRIGVPIFPVFLSGIIRLLLEDYSISCDTFSASSLAMCLGFLSILVQQSLINSEILLKNEDKIEDISFYSTIYILIAIFFFALFGIIEGLSLAISKFSTKNLVPPLKSIKNLVFFLSPCVLIFSLCIQKSFKLKAKL